MKLRTRRHSIATRYPSVEQRRAAAKRERYARDIKFYGGAKWTKRQQRAMRGVAKAPFVFHTITMSRDTFTGLFDGAITGPRA